MTSTNASADARDADCAIEVAETAFLTWSATGSTHRRNLLNKEANLILERRMDLVATMVAETGATAGWSHFNVENAALMFCEAAAMTTPLTGETIPTDVPDNLAMSIRQPVGVCVGISQWNAPMILCAPYLPTPTLACGGLRRTASINAASTVARSIRVTCNNALCRRCPKAVQNPYIRLFNIGLTDWFIIVISVYTDSSSR